MILYGGKKAQKTNCKQFKAQEKGFKNVFLGRYTYVLNIVQSMINTQSVMVFTSGLRRGGREKAFGKGTLVLSRVLEMSSIH